MSNRDWNTVRIRSALKAKINHILKTKKLQSLGIVNNSQFVDLALRKYLEELEAKK